MTVADRLKSLDANGSVANEFRVRTAQGAVFSVVTVLAIIYLICTELSFNFQTTVLEKVHVNATTPAGLEMEFDITLHSVPCALLSVDANDPTGQPQSLHLDKRHHVWKHRMDSDGNLIGSRSRLEFGSTLKTEDHLREAAFNVVAGREDDYDDDDDDQPCGSCYGAGDEGECCDSCDDVKRAYMRKGWTLQEEATVEQCKHVKTSEEEEGEGCNVHGVVALSTGGGNLHLAPGRDLENFGKQQKQAPSIMDFVLRTFEQFNVSHTVHKLRFGKVYPGHYHQLDGESRNVRDAYGMYQYYFQVVPTLYKFLNGTTIQTNQYSVTEHMRHVNPGSSRGLPGVFFFYQVSALHVEIEEYRRGWVAFFTSVCAIVGGVVTLFGMLDQFVYSTMEKGGRQLAY